MIRGTTPTYTIRFEGFDPELIDDICLAFRQDNHELFLHASEGALTIAANGAFATLTQEQTNSFKKGMMDKQVKIKFTDGTVWATEVEVEKVHDVLHEEVL